MMGGNGMLTTALVGGGALGIGVLGYKVIKNKKAAAMGAVESAQDAAQVARSAGQAETLGMTPAMAAASQGGHFANAAQLHQLQMGMPPGHEWVSLHGNAAMLYNLNPERTMLLEALNNAAKSGSLGSMVNLGKGENALEGMERLLSALSKFK